MTYFADLTPCTYFPTPKNVTAIGWLDPAHPYTQGTVDADAMRALRTLRSQCWQPVQFCGFHRCELCPEAPAGTANLFIPSPTRVYVAPELVVHYIEQHAYKPPDEFLDAITRCPPMNSRAYFQALAHHGIHGIAMHLPKTAMSMPAAKSALTKRLHIPDALLNLAWLNPDRSWFEQTCLTFAHDDDLHVRIAALRSLGILARKHPLGEPARQLLHSLVDDPVLGEEAQDVLDRPPGEDS